MNPTQPLAAGAPELLRTLDLRQYGDVHQHGDRRAHGEQQPAGPGDEPVDYRTLVPRAEFDVDSALGKVRPICDDVAARGSAALLEYAEKFDHVTPPSLRVPAEALAEAEANLDPAVRAAFEVAIERRRKVCQAELGEKSVDVEVAEGALITQKMIPITRVGLYVPGGLAPLASSVVMNVVPAQVAGVESIAVTSPPQAEFGGLPHPNILALCAILGIDEVYAVGGAQAVAMFAHGVPGLCRRVDMVTGPGNIYVVAAKRLLKGLIGIDSEAGPTEIAILADDTANPVHVAADLISQAEHDPMAGSVLVTDSESLAEQVRQALAPQVETTTHAERVRTALAGEQSGIVLVRDLEQGIEVVDAYAAEHLEIHTENAEQVAGRIRNAGAIFIGPWSPVSLGDYVAGSTHVLPTAGCACHSSGLNVKSFLKAVHLVNYSREALQQVAEHVEVFAASENLPAHGAAVTLRFSADQAAAGEGQK